MSPSLEHASPAISVVVRTLGSERLGDALESLAVQTRRDFEVVVVDMSVGRIEDLLDRFAPRLPSLRRVTPTSRRTRPAALNVGVRAARARTRSFSAFPKESSTGRSSTAPPRSSESSRAAIRREVERVGARQVFCESVEFYNPLHDLTLPLVRAAIRGMKGIEVLEFPLIAERAEAPGTYRVQRPPASRSADVLSFQLTKKEVRRKFRAARNGYPSLRAQMGPVLDGVEVAHAAFECFLPAVPLPSPGSEHVLRYEARARLLAREGRVDQAITWRDHFLPAVASLDS